VLEIFDRWLIRRKVNFLKRELEHTRDEAHRHAIEETLAAEERTLDKTFEGDKQQARH